MNYHRERRVYLSVKGKCMSSQIERRVLVLALIIVGFASPLLGQQKGQYVPGQYGLNAGAIPELAKLLGMKVPPPPPPTRLVRRPPTRRAS